MACRSISSKELSGSRAEDSGEFVSAQFTRVAEGYLDTIGVRLLRGRSITDEDRAANALVTVVSEPLAARLFPNGEAVGSRLKFALEGKPVSRSSRSWA
jgi:hypothetical protein